MNFRLEKIVQLSGKSASVYAVVPEGAAVSLFEQFLADHRSAYAEELKNILARLQVIGHTTGARDHYFKLNEGKLGDMVCALYDDPDKHLRLYGIRYGNECIIVGGGGPKSTRTWQEDPALKKQVEMMMEISAQIDRRLAEHELGWSLDYKDFKGDLDFKDEKYD